MAMLTLRKPLTVGVETGPLRATPVRDDRRRRRCPGAASPRASRAGWPTCSTSQSNPTPVASSTRQVASMTSGPMPSPGIRVTRWRAQRVSPWAMTVAGSSWIMRSADAASRISLCDGLLQHLADVRRGHDDGARGVGVDVVAGEDADAVDLHRHVRRDRHDQVAALADRLAAAVGRELVVAERVEVAQPALGEHAGEAVVAQARELAPAAEGRVGVAAAAHHEHLALAARPRSPGRRATRSCCRSGAGCPCASGK